MVVGAVCARACSIYNVCRSWHRPNEGHEKNSPAARAEAAGGPRASPGRAVPGQGDLSQVSSGSRGRSPGRSAKPKTQQVTVVEIVGGRQGQPTHIEMKPDDTIDVLKKQLEEKLASKPNADMQTLHLVLNPRAGIYPERKEDKDTMKECAAEFRKAGGDPETAAGLTFLLEVEEGGCIIQ